MSCWCSKMLFRATERSQTCARNDVTKLLYCLLFAAALNIATGWNLNARNVKLFNEPNLSKGSRASYFGYSVALYPGNYPADASVLVGAPRSNVSTLPSVPEPGTVYACRIDDEKCVGWNLHATDPGMIAGMNNSWTGAAIQVDKNGAPPGVAVSAPRWIDIKLSSHWLMHGMCYWSIVESLKSFENPAKIYFSPLKTNARDQVREGMFHYGMGEAGASLHLYSDRHQPEILLGSPGMDNWRGAPILIKELPYTPAIIPEIGTTTGVLYNDYLGYSVTSGCYFRKGVRMYAGGAPRGGDNMTGQVVIFRFPWSSGNKLETKALLYGEQLGEYFGASLASCNVDESEIDEIIVGAPMWSSDVDDQGRVYVYYLRNRKLRPVYLEGAKTSGRFGSVVTCLGDLDRDGFGDIAVGAPYEDGHGAIYIYNGNRGGLNTGYSQRILGKDIHEGIRGFGASISEPRDVDRNAYVDVAVGAYLSGDVVLLRSQPVVTIRVSVTGPPGNELRTNAERFNITVCSVYVGHYAPPKIAVKTILKLDPRKAFYGLVNKKTGIYEIPGTLDFGLRSCSVIEINLVKDVLNALEPIEIGVSLDPMEPPARNFCGSCPLIDRARSTVNDSLTLYYQLNCGPKPICNSIFEISSFTVTGDGVSGDRYTLGSDPNVRLAVRVANSGEPAYNAQIHIFIPPPISPSRMPPKCWDTRHNGFLEITCSFGTLLNEQVRDDETTLREIYLDMSNVRSDTSQLLLFANVTTGSRNIDSSPFISREFTIHFDVDVDMAIAGKSPQGPYSYANKDQVQLMERIRFEHIYEVQKFGKSPIEESVMIVSVPTHLLNADKSVAEIASVNETLGIMEGQPLDCTVSSHTDDQRIVNRTDLFAESLILENAADTGEKNSTGERLNITAENSKFAVPPANRTFYLNCTNQAVKCAQISCKLPRLADSLTVAKLTITLDLQLQNFQSEIFESRDVIFFVSNGSVSGSVLPLSITERVDDKPDTALVGTIFVGSPIASRIAVWIIVLSVLLGILLLVLLTLGLVKLGFFHRNKKEQLQALMAESDKNHGFVLETSSSREALDND